ncbi:hypothetical protein [Mesorhizobium xinjiangense]|uniref:hypothetical protein n=1 Tax=Mesorhizobium xinjiangense TaxID=2678685 RepID=UPI0012ED28D6|nr:hypothetical protein [Mesorhizobium xinjiangense]
MIRQPHSSAREIIVGKAIQEVVRELRMVEVADYVAFIRLEHFAAIDDLVESAAELYFMPGTLRFGHGGDVDLAWSGEPTITLDMQLRPSGATIYFTLTLTALRAGIDVSYVSFDDASNDPTENTRRLATAIAGARIMKSETLGA